MPLIRGKKAWTREGISRNISQLCKDGYEQKQAIAIALDIAKREKAKSRKKKKTSLKKKLPKGCKNTL